MVKRVLEPWRYNPAYGTAIDLGSCQFGLKTDGRCDALLCKFRTSEALAPKKEMEIGKLACPREREYEDNGEAIRVTD
jgi:hypothetical protein